MTGLRPMRSDSHGAPKPEIAEAKPSTLSSEPMAGPGMPRTSVRNFGRKVQPMMNHPTMNTEIRQQTSTLRTANMSKRPSLLPSAAASGMASPCSAACASLLGSRTQSQMPMAHNRPGTPETKKAARQPYCSAIIGSNQGARLWPSSRTTRPAAAAAGFRN